MPNVTFVLEAQEAKAVDAFLRVVDAQRKAEGQFGKTTSSAKNQESAMAALSGHLVGMVAGWQTVTKVMELAAAQMGAVAAAQKEMAATAKLSQSSAGVLSQLAAGSPKDMARLRNYAEGISSRTGMDQNQANDLAFALDSTGLGGDSRIFEQLYGSVENLGELAKGVAEIQNAFDGKAGDAESILSRTFAVAGKSIPKASELLQTLPKSVYGVRNLGGDVGEAMAAMGVGANVMEPEAASARIGQFAKFAAKKGFGGEGLFAAVQKTMAATQGMDSEQMAKFIPDTEALTGFKFMADKMADMKAMMGTQGAAVSSRMASQVAEARFSDPRLRALQQADIARETERVARERAYAAEGAQESALVSQLGSAGLAMGEQESTIKTRKAVLESLRGFGVSSDTALGIATSQQVGLFGSFFTGGPVGDSKDYRESLRQQRTQERSIFDDSTSLELQRKDTSLFESSTKSGGAVDDPLGTFVAAVKEFSGAVKHQRISRNATE